MPSGEISSGNIFSRNFLLMKEDGGVSYGILISEHLSSLFDLTLTYGQPVILSTKCKGKNHQD